MKKIAFEKIPESIRIDLGNIGHPGYFVLVIPNTSVSPKYREFYLIGDESDTAKYMFGIAVDDDQEAADIASTNAPYYKQDDKKE